MDRSIRTPASGRRPAQHNRRPCNRSTSRRNTPCHGFHDSSRYTIRPAVLAIWQGTWIIATQNVLNSIRSSDRFFFYITNDRTTASSEIVFLANDRCDQENLIAQSKGGVKALAMPVGDLVGNWAYMVMASLAWSLKAWSALVLPEGGRRSTGRRSVRSCGWSSARSAWR